MINHRPKIVLVASLLFAAGVSLLRAEDYAISTFAGRTLTAGSADGTPGTFNNPLGIAIDAAKNLYVADTTNHTIRKISPSREVSTLAGSAGIFGANDGTGSAARFNFPIGLAVDSGGNVYVADSRNSIIRKISATGAVTTFAGTAGQFGSSDGAGANARFFIPCGVAVDSAGNVFVADTGNHLIRKITPDGTVSTLAGTAQQQGSTNGTGGAARFAFPWGIAIDRNGILYVSDSGSHIIRRVTSAGAVTTFAGVAGVTGTIDTPRFNTPRGLSIDANGNLFVADYGNSAIRFVTAAGAVSTPAGGSRFGSNDSVGVAAQFNEPSDVVVDGSTIYIVDSSNNLIRRGVPASSAPLPVISVQPLEQEVAVGQSITFRVVATGSALTYEWLRNGNPIAGATNSSYTISSAQLGDSAAYSVKISGAGGSINSSAGNLTVTPVGTGPIAITARPISQSVDTGQSVTFSVAVNGSGITYQWLKNDATITGATNPSYTISSAQTGDAGVYSVRITSGSATETPFAKLIVGGSSGSGGVPITITAQPVGRVVEAGQSVTLSVTASGSGLTYQWYKDGNAIAGATSSSYAISNVQPATAGTYLVRVFSGVTSADSNPAALTIIGDTGPVGPTARLSNLSVRTAMAAGQTLIVGVVVNGGPRNVLVRAAGPALAAFGLTSAMADPRLDLFNGLTSTFSNDDWPANLADTFASVGAFAFPPGSRDAGFVQSIEGSRSIQARGTGAGVVLVEAYDLGTGNTPRLVNVSARNRVGTGDDILIAGFNVAGTGTKQLLIRAVGPKLTVFGVTGVLVDPKLEVYDTAGVKLTENDNWTATLASTFTAVGAFQLDAGSRDAALLTTLAPGSYTVQVRGADGGTGEALVEIYEVP